MPKSIEQRLQSLYQRRVSLETQIKQVETEKQEKERQRQGKREQLVGKVIYGLVESGEWTEQQFMELMDKHLKRITDRKLLGLEVKVSSKTKAPAKNTTSVGAKANPKKGKARTSNTKARSTQASKSSSVNSDE